MSAILTTTSTVLCPHGGRAVLFASSSEVRINGAPVLLQTDLLPVVGCPFTPAAFSPCVSIRWVSGATQAAARGVPLLLQSSVGICQNAAQAPQGTAVVAQAQSLAQAS